MVQSRRVDLVSVFAHIAKTQVQEVIVEEKRKRDEDPKKKSEDIPTTSKRQMRSSAKREEPTTLISKVLMEEDPKESKKKGPSFKLKSNIEMMTDIHKVLEERVLSSKVEMRLSELLAIVKPEFPAMFNNLTKRKRQVIEEQPSESTGKALNIQIEENLEGEELESEEEETIAETNVKHVHFQSEDDNHVPRSHYTKSH